MAAFKGSSRKYFVDVSKRFPFLYLAIVIAVTTEITHTLRCCPFWGESLVWALVCRDLFSVTAPAASQLAFRPGTSAKPSAT